MYMVTTAPSQCHQRHTEARPLLGPLAPSSNFSVLNHCDHCRCWVAPTRRPWVSVGGMWKLALLWAVPLALWTIWSIASVGALIHIASDWQRDVEDTRYTRELNAEMGVP